MKIALVTDSTADLTPFMKEKFNTHVIPLKIHFGQQEYFDGELTADEFYHNLKTAPELPRSSQPSPGEFIALYEKILKQYDNIISIHLSSALSGTVNAARLAAETLKRNIYVVDSKNISLGIGLMVEEAARCIEEGMLASHILERLQLVRNNLETLFTLNTLEYLYKGGRIGKVASILGSILNIKPIVQVNSEGVYIPVGKTRSLNKALEQIVQQIDQLAKGRKIKTLAVAHGAALGAADKLRTALEYKFNTKVAFFTQVGEVIGVHTGPGTVGAAVQFNCSPVPQQGRQV
jgi:DegV family protein with EDD domain